MGIGEAIAKLFADEGARVVLLSRDAGRAEAARERIGHSENTLALSCDFRIAAESARLGDTSLKFGLIPDEGGAYLFPKFMGLERALKMSLFSEVYTAHEAKELGLVTEVVDDAELMPTARQWAQQLAAGPPIAIRITKRMMHKQQTMSLDNALEDAALSTIATNYTDDVKEGIAAFHAKRQPNFKGR